MTLTGASIVRIVDRCGGLHGHDAAAPKLRRTRVRIRVSRFGSCPAPWEREPPRLKLTATILTSPCITSRSPARATMPNVRAVDDLFTGGIEDTLFTTVGAASVVIPLAATGWDIHEELLRNVNQYPTDTGGRDWK